MAGEVGLSGEIRPVMKMEQRVKEAQKLGMKRMLVPAGSLKGADVPADAMDIVEVAKVEEAFRALFA